MEMQTRTCLVCKTKQYYIEWLLVPILRRKHETFIGRNACYSKKSWGKCVSPAYVNARTNLKWECECGVSWSATPSSVMRGSWCPACGIKKSTDSRRFSIEVAKELAKSRGGKCLSDSYVNNSEPLLWECSDGHRWQASLGSVKDRKSWCPYCNWYYTEEKCRFIFESLTEQKFPKNRSFIGIELDGYCEDFKFAFEYNGKQHYSDVAYFANKSDFSSIKKRDKLKADLCRFHGVDLCVIPYWESEKGDKSLLQFIIHFLRSKNIPIVNSQFDIGAFRKNLGKLKRARQYAESKGGKCLSKILHEGEPLVFQCSQGHTWSCKNILGNRSWCRKCHNRYQSKRKRKHSISKMRDLAKKRGGDCLSSDYENNATKLEWICYKGHEVPNH